MIHLRPFTRATGIAGISVLGLAAGLALSACSASGSSAAGAASGAVASAATSSATSSAGQAAASPAGASAPGATAAASGATSAPVQKFPDGTFYAPSGNISCELNYPLHGQIVMACQTIVPRLSVRMSAAGKYTIVCTGQKCGPDSPQPAPTLAYGRTTVSGPFRCTSATAGVTCLAGGKGFQISRSGVTPVSS